MLVDGTPEPMLFPGDADDDLIQVPFVATARRSLTDAVGEYPPEFEAPLPDRLVGYRDAAGGLHLLDHAQAQREPKIQSYRVADDLSGVAMAGVNRVSRRRHPARLPDHPAPTKPALGQLDGAGQSFQLTTSRDTVIFRLLICLPTPHSDAFPKCLIDWVRGHTFLPNCLNRTAKRFGVKKSIATRRAR